MGNFREKIKRINNLGAYKILKDKDRLNIESDIQNTIKTNPAFPKNTGLFLTEDDESLPIFGPVGNVEHIISRKGGIGNDGHAGARIVLTKDNYGHRGTGLGGHGFTMCEAIDIVAGSLSCEEKTYTGSTTTRANFITDGARIYLTERGDIQHYFAIGKRSEAVSLSSKMKSGIGMKADQTLIMGRERVMILAGLALAEGGDRTVTQNSNVNPKIEIARVNDKESQPAVLGNNLVEYLGEMKKEMQKLRNKIQEVNRDLMEYKYAMATHQHTGFGLGAVTVIPSPDAASEAIQSVSGFFKENESSIRDTYNSVMNEYKRSGTKDGLLMGTSEDRILSSTVYIGK